VPGGNKDNLIEVEGVRNLARRDKVTVVNGVKGSAHDADSGAAIARK
jgi:hypothetical protein